MKHQIIIAVALAAMAVGSQAADKPAKACKKGELGGIVASNVKNKDGSYTTKYVGDTMPYNTPANAADLLKTVAPLKPGQKNCFKDDGS